MTVSIIIAVKAWQRHLEECVAKCCAVAGDDVEVIVLPDTDSGCPKGSVFAAAYGASCRVVIVPTGEMSPPRKRDLGMHRARGEILAFLDDDAYPTSQWLSAALTHFRESSVAAVAGPAVTPPQDTLRQQASGFIYASTLVSGPYAYRYVPRRMRCVDDYPSCNLFVRRQVMMALGGFNTEFWPGEDTQLCLGITQRLKKKIVYDPRVLVYHHRRPVFGPHLRQVASYALHRGYFIRLRQRNSLKPGYFLPSVLVASLIGGVILSILIPPIAWLYALAVTLYCILGIVSALVVVRETSFSFGESLRLTLYVSAGILLTHLTYGIFFLRGLLARTLREER